MLAIAFPAQAFATNCYVIAPGEGEECLIVDPGIGVEDTVAEVLAQYRLKPAAVLLTHGHLDHVYAVAPVCGGNTAAYIHGDDRYRLQDPLALVNPGMLAMMEQQFGQRATWREPDRVVEVTDRQHLTLAGLEVDVLHAPGHTEGSVMFGLEGIPAGVEAGEELTRTMVSGDVLFAGSIGRTDLPGGSGDLMTRSLREVVLPLPDDTLVLTGHGPATTMRRERATNPYLQGL
ncbi:MAG TPA: MBL fold metallo-hydrolase [Phycicoccus elongatus]|uniref:MBL fold metallo-hydrolase n=1 Tax=Phycicoccus TaxID=367298 RepID=UPI001DA1445D|nr:MULTISPECIES: MBL fold metallo-hydrolase [Phycicoccus]MBK8727895.1 MBL fold metallo-hydrolase [Tetrasphaera sp.]MCB1239714.1 MBL fold metallo-hydrolase [Tetrasphaera sp.]MCB9405490.1 MBL fold metallo-hydrolase [Tetrasphaera sp.]MCO5301766.1 MBL fold metallo-hydrolase [Phycicoccus sp.]HPF76960.1 MBL fold metallo-hydrolase [Phycicoccus elongatus]